jgi:hypothetical protein
MKEVLKTIVSLTAYILLVTSHVSFAATGFVKLPANNLAESAYVICNNSGDYGLANAEPPEQGKQETCALLSEELTQSALNPPLEGFRLVGMLVSDVEMPEPYAGKDKAVAVLSEAIWRNQEKTQCVLGTQVEMRDAPLADGSYWEINDITRGGFAGRELEIAYFYKPHSQAIGGNTEVLFRAGRTFTSVKTQAGNNHLPSSQSTNSAAFSGTDTAAINDNWVDFTTDISFKDKDGVTRAISSIFYIKYDCDGRDPTSVAGAIRLRSTGQNGNEMVEVAVPGLVPADAALQ